MKLKQRVGERVQQGLLSPDNGEKVLDVLRYFENCQGMKLSEQMAGMLVSHLCEALERISHGESIRPLDASIFEETSDEPVFELAVSITRDICKMLPEIPSDEAEYLIMHIGVMLGNMRLAAQTATI